MGTDLELCVRIIRGLVEVQWEDSDVSGSLIVNAESLELLRDAAERNLLYPSLRHNGNLCSLDLLKGETLLEHNIQIRLQPPQKESEFFAPSLGVLLERPVFMWSAPETFYIADLDYLHEEEGRETPETVVRYLAVLSLIELLEPVCDYREKGASSRRDIYIGTEKVVLPIEYSIEDLEPLAALDELAGLLSTDPHKDQKLVMMKAVLVDLLARVPERERFNYIIKHFDEIRQKFINSYDLFVSEFSFEKIRDEIEERKLEFTIRLNKVFSEIQNKLLAIPVALILVGGQMEKTGSVTLKNFLILLGAFVFSVLMQMLIHNQRQTLKSLKEEIDRQRDSLRHRYVAVSAKFEGAFDQLGDRYSDQELLLDRISLLVWAGFCVALVAFIWFSGDFKH